jgi:hypothetical protein
MKINSVLVQLDFYSHRGFTPVLKVTLDLVSRFNGNYILD